MAVARVRQLTNAASVTSNTLPVTNSSWSPGPAAGNLEILTVMLYGASSAITMTTPTGWVLANSGAALNNTTRAFTAVFYRVASGTSADTITSITTANAASGRWSIEEWSGLASKAVIDSVSTPVTYTATASATPIPTGTPSPATATTFTYGALGQRLSATPTSISYAWSSGYTVGLAPAVSSNTLGTAYKSNTTSGSQGTLIVTPTFAGASNTAASGLFVVFNQTSSPTAAFTSTMTNNVAQVNASTSASTNTNIVTYSWNWGDGTAVTNTQSTSTNHTYATSGNYNIVLTITDDKGQQTTAQRTVTSTFPDLPGWITTGSAVYPGNLFYWDGATKRTLNLNDHYNHKGGLYYASYFTGTNGATLPAEWTTQPGGGSANVSIQNNRMSLTTDASAWSGGPVSFLNGLMGIDDFEATFRMTFGNMQEQYHFFAFRLVNDEVYPGGNGAGLPKTGYAVVFAPNGNRIEIQEGLVADNSNAIASFPVTFPSNDIRVRINATQKTLSIKIWANTVAEPSAWTWQGNVIRFQNSGRFMYRAANGPNSTASSFTIDNFHVRSTRQHPALLNTQPAPIGNLPNYRQVFIENFDITASANGPMKSTYANSWQPYDDGGIYFPGTQVSAHDGVLDCALDGTKGAAGSFGGPVDAFNRVGGKFSMRAKAIGGDGNGTAVMVWPNNDVWNEGELDYPEANFETTPMVHHHVMNQGDNTASEDYDTTVSWRDWHVYSTEWIPGVSVKYYLDGVLLTTITHDVPTSPHRYMFQVGNYGSPGNFYIDWVSIWAYDTTVTGDSVAFGAGNFGQGIYG